MAFETSSVENKYGIWLSLSTNPGCSQHV